MAMENFGPRHKSSASSAEENDDLHFYVWVGCSESLSVVLELNDSKKSCLSCVAEV